MTHRGLVVDAVGALVPLMIDSELVDFGDLVARYGGPRSGDGGDDARLAWFALPVLAAGRRPLGLCGLVSRHRDAKDRNGVIGFAVATGYDEGAGRMTWPTLGELEALATPALDHAYARIDQADFVSTGQGLLQYFPPPPPGQQRPLTPLFRATKGFEFDDGQDLEQQWHEACHAAFTTQTRILLWEGDAEAPRLPAWDQGVVIPEPDPEPEPDIEMRFETRYFEGPNKPLIDPEVEARIWQIAHEAARIEIDRAQQQQGWGPGPSLAPRVKRSEQLTRQSAAASKRAQREQQIMDQRYARMQWLLTVLGLGAATVLILVSALVMLGRYML